MSTTSEGAAGAVRASPGYSREKVRVGSLPLSTKLYQAIGALPDALKNFAFGALLLFYYNQVLGVSASLASLGIMLALIVDAITDPVVGSLSDNMQSSRFGRRHLLMYGSALPLGLSLFFIFVPLDGLSDTGLFMWLTAFAIAVRVSMTFFLVPWTALFAEFSDDYVERSNILTYRYLFGWAASVGLGFGVWTWIFPTTEAYAPGHLNPDAYTLFAVLLATSATLAVLFTTVLTHREIPYLLQPTHVSQPMSLARVLGELLLALKNRNFLILFTFLLFLSALGGALGTLEIYMQTYFWGLLTEDMRWYSISLVGAAVAFSIVNLLQKRFDKKHLVIGAVAFALVNGMAMVNLRFLGLLPENGDDLLLAILIGSATLQSGAAIVGAVIGTSMFADIMDQQELQTGFRQEGMFSSAQSFSVKATSGLGLLLGGLLLDFVVRFPEGITPKEASPDLLFDLGLVAGILIPACYVVPFFLISRYNITREAFEDIRTELRSRR